MIIQQRNILDSCQLCKNDMRRIMLINKHIHTQNVHDPLLKN